MNLLRILPLVGSLVLAFGLSVTARCDDAPAATASTDVDFATQIMPLLQRNCTACHHSKKAEGGLILESYETLMKGGDSGPGAVAKDHEASFVWSRSSGAEEPIMPPEDNTIGAKPLSAGELELLKAWIQQGARRGEGSVSSSIQWNPIAQSLQPIYAVALSKDGRFAVAGRGNLASVYDVESGEVLSRLVDESLSVPATDLDIVQALAVSPDGQRIATGGYKTAKIWRQATREQPLVTALYANVAGSVAVNHDASKIALVNGVGDVEIWDRAAGQRLGLLLAGRPPEGGTPAMDRVTHLAWADNPLRLFAADTTGRLSVWDVGAAGPLATRDSDLSVHALAASHDGAFIAVLGGDKRVKLFRLQSAGEPAVWSLEAIESPVVAAIENARAIAFTREPSPHLLIALQSGAIQMLNSTAWEKRHEFSHGAEVTSVALSPDGSRLAVGGIDGRATLWNIALDKLGAEPVLKFEARASFANAIASASEEVARQEAKGTRHAAAMTEKETFAKNEAEALKGVQAERDKQAEALKAEEAKLTEVAAAVTAHEAMIEEAKKAVEQVNAQADADDKAKQDAKANLDKLIAELAPKVTARDEATKKRDAAATLLMQKEQTLANATDAKQRADAAIPIQAKLIATQARLIEQSKQRLADLETRATAAATPVESLVMSAGSVAIAFRGGAVHVHRLSDSALTDEFKVQSSSATSALSAMFFADNATLVLMQGSNSSSTAHAYSWSLRPDWRLERAIGGLNVDLLNDRVSGLAFSPDGKSLAIGSGTPSRDGQVKIFAAATGELLRDYGDAHSDSVLALRFSPDGNKIASGAADRTIRILDVATGKVERTLEGHTHHVLGVDWQPDSVGLVSSSADQTVKVWNTETGNVTRTIAGFPKEVTAIVFSAAPRQTITACADGNVRIHKVDDGGGVRTFGVGGDFLHCVATTKDGKVVVAGGQSGKLAFWTGDDGKSIRELK